MNSYQTSTPRALSAVAAVVLAALTLGLLVVAPASLDAVDRGGRTQAHATPPVVPTEVAIIPARIDVIGVREPEVAVTRNKPVRQNPNSPG